MGFNASAFDIIHLFIAVGVLSLIPNVILSILTSILVYHKDWTKLHLKKVTWFLSFMWFKML